MIQTPMHRLQEMQNGLDRESSSLQDLESQKQDAQERLEEMDQQRSKLEGMLNDIKMKCQEESQMVRDGSYEKKCSCDLYCACGYMEIHMQLLCCYLVSAYVLISLEQINQISIKHLSFEVCSKENAALYCFKQ